MQCDRCDRYQLIKAGRNRAGRPQYRCRTCWRRLTERSATAFCGFRFPDDIHIVTTVLPDGEPLIKTGEK